MQKDRPFWNTVKDELGHGKKERRWKDIKWSNVVETPFPAFQHMVEYKTAVTIPFGLFEFTRMPFGDQDDEVYRAKRKGRQLEYRLSYEEYRDTPQKYELQEPSQIAKNEAYSCKSTTKMDEVDLPETTKIRLNHYDYRHKLELQSFNNWRWEGVEYGPWLGQFKDTKSSNPEELDRVLRCPWLA